MTSTPFTNGAPYVIETDGLTKRFGERVAVDGVDLAVSRGQAFGFLGPNGAGKTTLIRMLLGLTEPTSGSMRLLGRPLPIERAAALARVGAIVEEPRFHPQLTGRQNLYIVAACRERETHDRIPAALERVGLADRADEAAGDGVRVVLAPDSWEPQAVAAEIARRMIGAGLELHRLEIARATLEQRFMEITTRLGEAA